MMRVGVAVDRGGWELKQQVTGELLDRGYSVTGFGAYDCDAADDYPDYVASLARSVPQGQFDRGIAVCGSGVDARIVSNKVNGIRAGMVHEIYSTRRGVEDDNMTVICLSGRVVSRQHAPAIVSAFLNASFYGGGRFQRRLDNVDRSADGKAQR